MAFLSADQRELFLPLIEGIHESPPWSTFMRNLVARTYARRAFLIITLANAMDAQEPLVLHVSAPRATQEPPLDFRRIAALNLHPYGQLRPERVYGLDELLDYGDPLRLEHQRKALIDMGIRYGRWLRIRAGDAADAWIFLAREREDFSAAAVATLAAIAPHLAVALRAQVKLAEQRLQSELAQAALARLGVAQLAFDRNGRVMAADALAERQLAFAPEPEGRPGRRLQLLPEIARQLDEACAAWADGDPRARAALCLDPARGLFLMLRAADLGLPMPAAQPAVIGALRLARREEPRRAIAVLAAVHGLSPREAALAHAMSLGESIVEAGARLRLTPETARNYSKRIYAKTGASGQADLVRMVLTGPAVLA